MRRVEREGGQEERKCRTTEAREERGGKEEQWQLE